METTDSLKSLQDERLLRQQYLIEPSVQERMNQYSVYSIGAGTVGAAFLAGVISVANPYYVYVSDGDTVSRSNLNRAPWFAGKEGMPKAKAVEEMVSLLSPQTRVEANTNFDTPLTAQQVVFKASQEKGSKFFVSACDNLPVQAALHIAAHRHGIDVVLPTDIGARLQLQYFPYSQWGTKLYNGRISPGFAEEIVGFHGKENEIDPKKRLKYLLSVIGIMDLDAKVINAFLEGKKNNAESYPQCILSAGLIPGVAAAFLEKHAKGEKIKKKSVTGSSDMLETLPQRLNSQKEKAEALIRLARSK